MDSVFRLDEISRANFLRLLMRSFGCTYLCLWSYHPSNESYIILVLLMIISFLYFLDGLYNDENNQPSSSSETTSLARRLFDEYRASLFVLLENDRVPGHAFRNNLTYFELQELDLQRLAINETQRQFYQEARIKVFDFLVESNTAVFMGCKSGEIELGLSNESQVDIKMEMMRTWFPEEFSRQSTHTDQLPAPSPSLSPRPGNDQNPPSSSSSSLISVSMDSPEYSSLLFNIPITTTTTSQIPEAHHATTADVLQPLITPTLPHHQAMQAFARLRNIQFPSPESEAAAMTRAMLAVLSSPSSSSSSHQPPPQFNLPPPAAPPDQSRFKNPKASVFKKYMPALAPSNTQIDAPSSRQSMPKRSISFFRNLNIFMRTRQRFQETRPTTTQLHHMMSERKRREKLNESFHALRSLLPPGTKKDKASVLSTTREYLTSLHAQVEELTKRNQQLEAQVLKEGSHEEAIACSSPNERVDVRVSHVSESTSEESQLIDLQVSLRTQSSAEDILIRILEFLRQVNTVSLLSMEANTHITESSSTTRLILRLRVEGGEWDESAFQEAVRRVVDDLAH